MTDAMTDKMDYGKPPTIIIKPMWGGFGWEVQVPDRVLVKGWCPTFSEALGKTVEFTKPWQELK